VETFVPGAEVAVEGLLRGGVLETLAVFDKPDPLEGPYFEETIYVTPSRLAPSAVAAVERTAAAACAAMGLVEGPVHVELRTEGGTAWLIEVAARSIGGLCSRSLSFGVGLSLERLIVAHALGMPLDGLSREQRAAGVMMLPIPARGRLEGVSGQEEALRVPGITGLDISIAPGRPVRPLPEGDRYLGFLFAKGDTAEEVEASLRRAHAHLGVRVVDDEQGDG
jgi:biotin carboxylase